MMKQEFENLIGKEVSDKDYEVIDRVYTFHPAISETEGKKQIADIYNAGGMGAKAPLLLEFSIKEERSKDER